MSCRASAARSCRCACSPKWCRAACRCRPPRVGPRSFVSLVDLSEGRAGVVVCLLAVLELIKAAMVEVEQKIPFTEFTIRLAGPKAVTEDATE